MASWYPGKNAEARWAKDTQRWLKFCQMEQTKLFKITRKVCMGFKILDRKRNLVQALHLKFVRRNGGITPLPLRTTDVAAPAPQMRGICTRHQLGSHSPVAFARAVRFCMPN
jgi:hypothetical protein